MMLFEPVIIQVSVTNADLGLRSSSATTDDKHSLSLDSRALLATMETAMYENVSCSALPRGRWCRASRIRLVAIPKRQVTPLKNKEEVSPRIVFYANNSALI